MIEKCFKNNTPGIDWVNSFIKCNNLSKRVSQHIKSVRAEVSPEDINAYFDNLEVSLDGVEPECIINYDQTNLSDDPGASTVVCSKGSKRAHLIINTSKQ